MKPNRSNIEATLAQLKAKAKELGCTLDCDPEFFQDDDHLNCVWYGGQYATLQDKAGNFLEFCVCGDVRICDTADDDWYYASKSGEGALSSADDALRDRFAGDAELAAAEMNGEIRYDNNNWIEIFIRPKGSEQPIDSVVGDSDDLLEELSDLSGWADVLKQPRWLM